MIIYNGKVINTIEELEIEIAALSDSNKFSMRSLFNQLPAKPLAISSLLSGPSGDPTKPPMGVDYVTGLTVKLHRKQVMVKGEVKEETFFKNFDGKTHSGIVVKEVHLFNRDIMGFAKSRNTMVTWYYEDGTECQERKAWTKHYDSLQMIEEGITRRSNIIKNLQPKVMFLLMNTLPAAEVANTVSYGRSFLSHLKVHFENFADHSDKTLYVELQKPELLIKFPWLNNLIPGGGGVTILLFILNEVSI